MLTLANERCAWWGQTTSDSANPPLPSDALREGDEMSIGVDRRVHDLAAVFLEDATDDWPEDFIEAKWDAAVDEFAQEIQATVEDRLTEFMEDMWLHLALREVGLAQ